MKKGTKIVQYVNKKTGKVGDYFAPAGSDANTLGINTEGRIKKVFTLTEDVKVLKSTAADFTDDATGETYKGGGTQFFGPEIKSSVEEVKN